MLLKKSKLFSIVMCMITVLSVLSLMIPRNVSADGNDKSLTLVCVSDDTILAGMEWKIYRVGHRVSNSRNFVQTGDFSGVQVNMKRLTPETVQQVAQTFQAYAIASGIEPIQSGTTNQAGEVQFTGLSSGLYLISGKLLKIGSNYYQPTTALVELTDEDTDLKYNAYPKFEYQVMNGKPVAHVVYKEWLLDELHLDGRPDHVTVDIYRDEEYYETIILSDENNWRYRWVDPDGSSNWIVMEKEVPAQYELNIEYNQNYRIQNSYTDEPFTNTSVISSGTTTTTTAEPMNTNVSLTTTSNTVQNIEASRTRTTTGATETSGTTTVNTIHSGAASETNNTTTSTGTASGTTTTASDTTGSNTTSSTTKKSNSGGGSGGNSGGGSGNGGYSGGKTNNSSNNKITSSGSTKLPQTGQLWWPVVPLSIGGVLCISAGLAIKTRKKDD